MTFEVVKQIQNTLGNKLVAFFQLSQYAIDNILKIICTVQIQSGKEYEIK